MRVLQAHGEPTEEHEEKFHEHCRGAAGGRPGEGRDRERQRETERDEERRRTEVMARSLVVSCTGSET